MTDMASSLHPRSLSANPPAPSLPLDPWSALTHAYGATFARTILVRAVPLTSTLIRSKCALIHLGTVHDSSAAGVPAAPFKMMAPEVHLLDVSCSVLFLAWSTTSLGAYQRQYLIDDLVECLSRFTPLSYHLTFNPISHCKF